jgi:hypothetical protein
MGTMQDGNADRYDPYDNIKIAGYWYDKKQDLICGGFAGTYIHSAIKKPLHFHEAAFTYTIILF